MTDRPITTLTLTIDMHQPVERERLFEDLRDHIAPMIEQGFLCGEMCVSTGSEVEDEVTGWWDLSWTDSSEPRQSFLPCNLDDLAPEPED